MEKTIVRDFGRLLLTKDVDLDSTEFRETLRKVESGSGTQGIVVLEFVERGFHKSNVYLVLNGNGLCVAHAYYKRAVDAYIIRSRSDISELSLLQRNGKVPIFRHTSLFSAAKLKLVASELLASSNRLRRVSAFERAKSIRIEQTSRLCSLIRSDDQTSDREDGVSESIQLAALASASKANQMFSRYDRSSGIRDSHQREAKISLWYDAVLGNFGGIAPSEEFPCPYSGFARICGEKKSRGQTIANWLIEAGLLEHSRLGTVKTGFFYGDGSPITQKVSFWRLLARGTPPESVLYGDKDNYLDRSIFKVSETCQSAQTPQRNIGEITMAFEKEAVKSLDLIETSVSAMREAVEGVVGLHEDFVENCNDIHEKLAEVSAAQILALEACIEQFQSEHEVLKDQLKDICNTHAIANKSYSDTFHSQLVQISETLPSFRASAKGHAELETKLAEARELLELDQQDLALDRQDFEVSLEKRRAEVDASLEEDRKMLIEAKALFEEERVEFEREKSEFEANVAEENSGITDALRLEVARLKKELESLERGSALRPSVNMSPFASGTDAFHDVREQVEGFLLTLDDLEEEEPYTTVDLNTSITWLMLNSEVKTKLNRLRVGTYGDLVEYSALELEKSGRFSKAEIHYLKKKMSYVGISLSSGNRCVDGSEGVRARAMSFLEMLDDFADLIEASDTSQVGSEGDTLLADESDERDSLVQYSSNPNGQNPESMPTSARTSDSTDSDVLRMVRTVPSEKWQLAATIAEKRGIFGNSDLDILRTIAVGLQSGAEISETVGKAGIELYRVLERRIRIENSSGTRKGNEFGGSELAVKNTIPRDVSAVNFVEVPLVRRVNLID